MTSLDITSRVKVRFAPSPTGQLHIGGARTALYNWLLARGSGGDLVLRIEDTDRERSTPENVEQILDALRWLELDWDEGPISQAERGERHREEIARLVDEGHAYEDEGAVRLRVPDEGETVVEDAIRGEVRFPHSAIDDFVIARSEAARSTTWPWRWTIATWASLTWCGARTTSRTRRVR